MKNFLKKRKVLVILISITLIGACLRLYKFHDFVRFNNDQVRDSKIVDKMVDKRDFPLLGPQAASTEFRLGPAYYYMEYVSALVFGKNPAGIAFFVVILSIASIPLLFVFLRHYFSESISLFVAFLYSVSFYAIKYSKFTWNPNVVPFFLFIFLILLLKLAKKTDSASKHWPLFLWIGILIGLGAQLHTMLMVLMPSLLFFVCAYLYFKTNSKRQAILGFILAIFTALLLNSTVFIYDFKNDGKNAKAFLSVTERRTEKNISIPERFLRTGQFFVQSNTYVLSGYESTKDWLEIKKFVSRKNLNEIIIATIGTLFFLSGFLILLISFFREKDSKRKVFLGIFLGTIIFSSLIFMLVTDMLKSRFFIIVLFLPYFFLGIILEKIAEFFGKRTAYAAAAIIVFSLFFLNFKVFSGIYSDNDYPRKDTLYGGISLKETEDISRFMVSYSKKETSTGKKTYLSGFEFFQSVNYFNKKSKLETALFPKGELNENEILFMVGKSKNGERILEKNNASYFMADSKDLGKFTVFVFERK